MKHKLETNIFKRQGSNCFELLSVLQLYFSPSGLDSQFPPAVASKIGPVLFYARLRSGSSGRWPLMMIAK